MSLSRPADEEHRNMVEERLNQSYMMLYDNDMSWDVAIQKTRPWVIEAKELGLRIKWMYTGRKWLNALDKDIKVYNAAVAYKAGGSDPQDSVMYFEQFLGCLEVETRALKTAHREKKRAFSVLKLYDDDTRSPSPPISQLDDIQDDDAFAAAMQKNVPDCWYGDKCNRPRCTFRHPKDSRQRTNGRERRQSTFKPSFGSQQSRFNSRFHGKPTAR